MDLNVELVKRMLTHCNFCRWNCQIDRSSAQTLGDGNGVREKTKNKHGTCQLESTSNVSSYEWKAAIIQTGLVATQRYIYIPES
jgi:uncharacterized Fe-S radical SAM superfamily protein PflX